jgi:hypothetical protein
VTGYLRADAAPSELGGDWYEFRVEGTGNAIGALAIGELSSDTISFSRRVVLPEDLEDALVRVRIFGVATGGVLEMTFLEAFGGAARFSLAGGLGAIAFEGTGRVTSISRPGGS